MNLKVRDIVDKKLWFYFIIQDVTSVTMCGIAQEANSNDEHEPAYTQPWHVSLSKVTTFIYYNLLLGTYLPGFFYTVLPCRVICENHVLDPL